MSEAYAEDLEPEADEIEAEEAGEQRVDIRAFINNPNIAHDLDPSVVATIGQKAVEEYKLDVKSLEAAGWDQKVKTAMKAATQVKEAKSYPWPNASNVKYPLITTAAIQFNARAMPAVIDGPAIVKGKVLGKPDEQKQDRADRVAKHMSWQLLDEMDGWEEDTDKLLIQLPIVGCAMRKTYFDPMKGYNCSSLVPMEDFVVEYMTKDLATCPRATQVLEFYPYQIREKMMSGLWLERELGPATNAANDDDAPHKFIEQHRLWDLDDDGYPEPYIVTVHLETQFVVRIVARFDEEAIKWKDDAQTDILRIEATQVFTKYSFIPSPDGSFYDIGFGTLLGPLGETINSTINQIMDAGHLANVQGGFIGEGVSLKSGNQTFRPGEWKKAGVSGGSLKDNIVPLPTKEPSSVLYNLMVFLIDAAKDVTATQDIMTGDTGRADQPVGTTLAIIEQGLKTFTAIVKRIHRALKHELKLLYRLNGLYLNPEVYFAFQDEPVQVIQDDYRQGDIDLVPVSDPSMATDMQKMGRAQFLQTMKGQGLNDMEINKRILEAASITDIKALLPPEDAPPPVDPKVELEKAKLALENRRLDIEEGKLKVSMIEASAKVKTANAGAAVDAATAQQTQLQNIMMAPGFQQQAAEMVVQLAAKMAGDMMGAPPSVQQPQVQQPDVRGMEQQPPDAGLPPVPPGAAGEAGPAMDGGPGDGPPPADQGAPPGGVGGPGMV